LGRRKKTKLKENLFFERIIVFHSKLNTFMLFHRNSANPSGHQSFLQKAETYKLQAAKKNIFSQVFITNGEISSNYI
jgi:hypothetical protein